MAISLSLVGLSLIIVSWVIQIVFILKGKKAIRPCFAALQGVGIILLVVDMYTTAGQMTSLAWLNAISALLAIVTMVLAIRK